MRWCHPGRAHVEPALQKRFYPASTVSFIIFQSTPPFALLIALFPSFIVVALFPSFILPSFIAIGEFNLLSKHTL